MTLSSHEVCATRSSTRTERGVQTRCRDGRHHRGRLDRDFQCTRSGGLRHLARSVRGRGDQPARPVHRCLATDGHRHPGFSAAVGEDHVGRCSRILVGLVRDRDAQFCIPAGSDVCGGCRGAAGRRRAPTVPRALSVAAMPGLTNGLSRQARAWWERRRAQARYLRWSWQAPLRPPKRWTFAVCHRGDPGAQRGGPRSSHWPFSHGSDRERRVTRSIRAGRTASPICVRREALRRSDRVARQLHAVIGRFGSRAACERSPEIVSPNDLLIRTLLRISRRAAAVVDTR